MPLTHDTPLAHRRFASLLTATTLAIGLAGCGGGGEEAAPVPEKPTASASPAAATPGPPVQRSQAPLPAPGQSGVSPRHGGLIASSGKLYFELAVVGGVARIYPYDGAGAPVAGSAATGTLTIDGEAHELNRRGEGDAIWVEGGSGLPNAFRAEVVFQVDGQAYQGEVRYAVSGN